MNALFAKEHKPRWLVSIPVRTLGAVLVMLAGFSFAVSIYMQAFAEDIYSARKQGVESIVSLAQNAIDPILEDTRDRKMTIGEGRLKATEVINQFVYSSKGVSNYVFLGTYEGYVLVAPTVPDTVGTYQMQRKDIYGTPITKLFLEKAKSGGGFVEYYESKSLDEKPQKKISYIIGLPEIECYLGTGIFVDDIEESIKQLQQKMMILGFLIIAGVLSLQYYFMRPLLRCLYWLSEVFKNLGEHPDAIHSFQPPAGLKNLDTEKLLASLKNMLINFHLYRRNIEQSAEKFRQIAYATNDVIWEWDSESHRTVWSGNIEKMVGYRPAGYGSHFEVFEDWVHQDDRKKRRQILAAYFSEPGESYTCEYRLYNESRGEYHPVLVKGIATFDENKTPVRMVGSIITISDFICHEDMKQTVAQVGVEPTDFKKIGDISQQTPYVNGGMLVVDVKKRLDNEQWQGIIVIEDNKPVGLIMRDALNFQLSGQYGTSLYYGRPIKMIMDEHPLIVDADLSLEQVATAAGDRPEAKLYDLIIVTENEEYHGTVSVMELLSRITDLRIQLAANASPLTGLPGNLVIEEKLKQALQHDFAALYIDLDNFKAFNDNYGFEMGDRAIKLTASILKDLAAFYDEKKMFVGHIGGDDFLALLYEPELAPNFAARIIEEFDARILSLYSQEDLANGYVTVHDRRGDTQRYPIMSISIALVDNCVRGFTNHLEVSEVAAQLKKRAKMMEGSIWVSDRRYAV